MKKTGPSLLIDVGGSYIKGAVYDGTSISSIHRVLTPGYLETSGPSRNIDTEEIFQKTVEVIDHLVADYGHGHSILMSGQMGGLVLLDPQTHKVLVSRSWQDSQSLQQRNDPISPERITSWDRFQDLASFDDFLASGKDIKPGSQIVQLFDLRQQNSEVFESKPFALTLIAYLANRIAGTLDAPLVHFSDAAASGHFDIIGQTWNHELLEILGLEIQVPQVTKGIVPITASLSSWDNLHVAVGDQQASLLGAGLSAGQIVVNIGTGGQVARLSLESESLGSSSYRHSVRPFFDDKFIRTITHLPSGRILSILVSSCMGTTSPEAYSQFLDLSGTEGEKAKLDLNEVVSLGQITGNWTPPQIARTYLDFMLESYLAAISELRLESTTQLVFAGGLGQRFKHLSRELALRTGLPAVVSKSAETTIEGLARLAKS